VIVPNSFLTRLIAWTTGSDRVERMFLHSHTRLRCRPLSLAVSIDDVCALKEGTYRATCSGEVLPPIGEQLTILHTVVDTVAGDGH
jgi:hypothetical protein